MTIEQNNGFYYVESDLFIIYLHKDMNAIITLITQLLAIEKARQSWLSVCSLPRRIPCNGVSISDIVSRIAHVPFLPTYFANPLCVVRQLHILNLPLFDAKSTWSQFWSNA